MENYDCDYLERKKHYSEINPYGNMFEFAKKYSSDYFANNIFNIYLNEDVFLMPGDSALVASIEYTPDVFILPSSEFFGPYLKLKHKIVQDENHTIMEIYIHNMCPVNGVKTPDYAGLEWFYKNVIHYIGDACIPVYYQKRSKLIAVGIRAKYDFNLEELYTRLYENRLVIGNNSEDTLKMFENYKNWILDAKNSERLFNNSQKLHEEQTRILKPNYSQISKN